MSTNFRKELTKKSDEELLTEFTDAAQPNSEKSHQIIEEMQRRQIEAVKDTAKSTKCYVRATFVLVLIGIISLIISILQSCNRSITQVELTNLPPPSQFRINCEQSFNAIQASTKTKRKIEISCTATPKPAKKP